MYELTESETDTATDTDTDAEAEREKGDKAVCVQTCRALRSACDTQRYDHYLYITHVRRRLLLNIYHGLLAMGLL